MNLLDVNLGVEYIVDAVKTEDEELNSFLLSLGCFQGEPITVVSRRRSCLVVAIKDGRYCMDRNLGEAIRVK